MCMRNPRWLFEIHSARACWGIDIWNRWRVLLDWYFVRPRWKNVCEKMYVYAHTKYWMPSQPFEDEIVWPSMIHIEWLSLLYISYGFWFDVGGNKGSVLLILCCCRTCGCTMNEEEISMKNIEYCDLLLYCTIEFETVHRLTRSLLNQDYRNHDRLRFKWLKNKCNNKWKLRGIPIFRGDIFLPT